MLSALMRFDGLNIGGLRLLTCKLLLRSVFLRKVGEILRSLIRMLFRLDRTGDCTPSEQRLLTELHRDCVTAGRRMSR